MLGDPGLTDSGPAPSVFLSVINGQFGYHPAEAWKNLPLYYVFLGKSFFVCVLPLYFPSIFFRSPDYYVIRINQI